jgi:glutaredoxin-related protein
LIDIGGTFMLRFFFVICLAFGAWKLYTKGNPFSGGPPVTGPDGKPLVILFSGPDCGANCSGIRSDLQARKVNFQEVEMTGPDDKMAVQYSINAYPTTIIGKRRLVGSDFRSLGGVLAEALGDEVLTRSEKMAMSNHFDGQGRAKVVLYGTKWCGYCRKQRELFAAQGIAFDDIDVEASERGMLAYSALKGSGYPLTYVGYRRYDGFNDGELMASAEESLKAR